MKRFINRLLGRLERPEPAPEPHTPPATNPPVEEPTAPAPEPKGAAADVFLSADALAINEARLCHLASLGLNLAGKKVLEVGGGIGLHTCFFESLGCDVLFTDARPENLAEARHRYPHRKTALLDLDRETDLTRFGMFDIVYCYGTLYHLSKPAEALQALTGICKEMILLETCVTPGEGDSLCPEDEPATVANQAVSGLGCRPTRPWVMARLRKSFGHAYHTFTQPLHQDFELNWLQPQPRKNYRSIFVGSKKPLHETCLSSTICDLQNPVPNVTKGVWLDVGAHLGETTYDKAREYPERVVYAFEPNLELAGQRFNKLPNYTLIGAAVGERDGFAKFHLNAFDAASSLLPFDGERLQAWIGGESLKPQSEVMVPTMRLDSFLDRLGIAAVDCLKIDTLGSDFSVILSAGERLADIRKIKLEVTVIPSQLHVGAAGKEQVVSYLTSRGFTLVAEQPQTHGHKENLVFFRLGPAPSDVRPFDFKCLGIDSSTLDRALQSLSDERLLRLASSAAELRPMGCYPEWSFACDDASTTPIIQLRHAIWTSCLDRRLEQPIVFPWYDGSKFNLYLGNDLSRPTFIGGCFEPNEFAFMGAFLKPGMALLDVGANEGLYTVFAAQRVGETGNVHAFEPSQREFLRLEANIRLNRFANVRLVAKAVAEAKGTTELRICEYGHEGQNTLGDFAHEVKQSGTQTVEICSLDEYFAEHGLNRLDFIKIDVEGSEQRVLEGARQTIARFKPVILLELNDKALRFQGATSDSVVAFLRECGYTIYNFAASSGHLAASDAGPYSDNIVAAHGELDGRYFEHSMMM